MRAACVHSPYQATTKPRRQYGTARELAAAGELDLLADPSLLSISIRRIGADRYPIMNWNRKPQRISADGQPGLEH